ncbi:MAG: BREX system serine/threonine kinase PglW [Gemmatimonadetes bacterium]|nr:BREX system serine/threonine kinase PglW [Gemmatimonadota bacterium]
MPSPRWTTVSESAFPWEAEAIAHIRDRLPESDSFRGWSNFEFVAQDGAVSEVDTLILTPTRLLLIEIKSAPGTVRADSGAWRWSWPDGRQTVDENPLFLASRKAKRLAGLLKSTRALKGKGAPYVEELVFLSNRDAKAEFTGPAGTRVFVRSAPQGSDRDLNAFIASCADDVLRPRMDWKHIGAVLRAMDELNIRPVQREFAAGQWKLAQLIEDTAIYQDYVAEHTKVAGSHRRVRVYPWPASGPDTGRKARREAALREFRLLDRADIHPGILRAYSFEETERGPAIVFEHPVPSERLDAFLLRRAPALDLRQRLRLVRELADALTWAHAHGLHHRTLTPSAVLVVDPDGEAPTVKIFNWQVGSLAEGTADGSTLTWHDFIQVGLGGRDANAVYLAPELRGGGRPDAALLDVFSLGAIAFHILTGRAPAQTPEELLQRIRDGKGLHVASALDGVDQDLDALIQLATDPDLGGRPSASEFLAESERIIGALAQEASAAADAGRWVHPMDAEQGAELQGGFVVKRRLGSGSTALALQVERDGRIGVLKIAREESLNDRIKQEGEIRRRLRHQHVVELLDVVEVSGLWALFLEMAGEQTLAYRLRMEGALTLELLQRFGDELLAVVDWLEQQAIPHRDLKPDNIGVATTPSRKLTLRLFDFSLSSTPADNIRAGTPGYLDPFLEERRPRRWDAAAERYSAAVTLHEMATGTLPVWGDGRQHPMTLDADVKPTLAVDRLDPAVRDGLSRFFSKALGRDPKRRFDTAEAMRTAWREIFSAIDEPTSTGDSSTEGGEADAFASLATADRPAPLSVLGLSPRVLNALERLGAQPVSDLVDMPRTRLYLHAGIGVATMREIRRLTDAAARAFAERGLADTPAGGLLPIAADDDEAGGGREAVEPALLSIELLQKDILSSRLANPDQRVLRLLMGLDAPPDATIEDMWPSQRDVAEALGLSRTQVADVVSRARTRWGKKPSVTTLRDDVAIVLGQLGGVATHSEVARALIQARGTTSPTEADQLRTASAILWAALELEGSRESTCRYRLQRGDRLLAIVSTAVPGGDGESLADPAAIRSWVEQLGAKADELADADPPLPPQRAVEELQAIPVPPGFEPPSADRLLRLAVGASEHAAATPRQEVYRRGLAASRALALGAGALLGVRKIDADHVRQRIAARYPDAERLPGRPHLDRMLEELGLPLVWSEEDRAYVTPASRLSLTSSGTQTHTPNHLSPITTPILDDAMDEARMLEERIAALARSDGGFLVLSTEPARFRRAELALAERHALTPMSLERLFVESMRKTAEANRVHWPLVLQADAAPHHDRAWRNLRLLAEKARPMMEATLAALVRPTLLLHPGLLARYDLLAVFEPLQDRSRRGPGVVLLLPSDGMSAMPVIDLVPLPMVYPSDWARLPREWFRLARSAA